MKILFFGDSITDACRDRTDPESLGDGYVKIASEKLRLLFLEQKFEILNRGVSGDRTDELLPRIQDDVAAEHPDIVVLEVGVNDVWRKITDGEKLSIQRFRENYLTIVKAIKETGARLIILQPYVLKVGDKTRLRPTLNGVNAVIREIAEAENVGLIPLDEIFTGVTQDIAPEQFAADGVHPTHRGCRYIADLVIKELKQYIG